VVQSQPGQNSLRDPILKNPITKKGLVEWPEFKPQYYKKEKKKKKKRKKQVEIAFTYILFKKQNINEQKIEKKKKRSNSL
jgi:hypothetical protein